MDQRCYYENRLIHISLDNIKNFKIEELKPKAQEPKASNSSLRPNQSRNAKTFVKAWKEKEKY